MFCYAILVNKVSIIIPAHNEAANIGRLLHHLHNQSTPPAEIIVIAHNCEDNTAQIASQHPSTKVITLNGPSGVMYARQAGFEAATEELIVSIDADSFPLSKHWLARLIAPLTHSADVVATGGPVIFYNHPVGFLLSLNFFWLKKLIHSSHAVYFWGANFCVRKSAIQQIGGLKYLISNKSRWDLTTDSDDYYLFKLVSELGLVKITNSAIVASQGPKLTTAQWLERSRIQGIDKQILDRTLG